MALDKNSAARLRRVASQLEKVLDGLHQVHGVLYPEPLRTYRDDVDRILKLTLKFSDRVERDIPPSRGGRPPKAASEEPQFEDLEEGEAA